jgi:hypothetical protein
MWDNRRSDLQCEACRNYNQEMGNSPFCVLEPTLSKITSCFKILKTRDLPLLANKVHQLQ